MSDAITEMLTGTWFTDWYTGDFRQHAAKYYYRSKAVIGSKVLKIYILILLRIVILSFKDAI